MKDQKFGPIPVFASHAGRWACRVCPASDDVDGGVRRPGCADPRQLAHGIPLGALRRGADWTGGAVPRHGQARRAGGEFQSVPSGRRWRYGRRTCLFCLLPGATAGQAGPLFHGGLRPGAGRWVRSGLQRVPAPVRQGLGSGRDAGEPVSGGSAHLPLPGLERRPPAGRLLLPAPGHGCLHGGTLISWPAFLWERGGGAPPSSGPWAPCSSAASPWRIRVGPGGCFLRRWFCGNSPAAAPC